VGCHSPAAVSSPGRNAAGEFFLCERFFFSAKKEMRNGAKQKKRGMKPKEEEQKKWGRDRDMKETNQ
jgi:hypothetical protein